MLRELRERGCWAVKYPATGPYATRGVPDILCCHNGQFFAYEMKTTQGNATKIQEREITRIHEAGGWAYIVKGHKGIDVHLKLLDAADGRV